MPLQLDNRCKEQLKEKLIKILPAFIVSSGCILSKQSHLSLAGIDNIIPRNKKEFLKKFISDTPFQDYVFGFLYKEIFEKNNFDANQKKIKLTDMQGYTDIASVADRLIEGLDNLPHFYRFTLELNRSISSVFHLDIIELSDNFRLIRPDDSFLSAYPIEPCVPKRNILINGEFGTISSGERVKRPTGWNSETVCLQFDIEGFIGSATETVPRRKAISLLKELLGIGYAIHAFTQDMNLSNEERICAYVHKKRGDTWQLHDIIAIDMSLSLELSILAADDLDGRLDTNEKKSDFFKNRLLIFQKIFSLKNANGDRIRLAGRWLLESNIGNNDLLSFVQAMVALEILLGEKKESDLTGLGALLSNRCAYLIGASHDDREKILSDFRRIYDIRSKIVHSGKDWLTQEERQLFWKLYEIVSRVIQKEAELI